MGPRKKIVTSIICLIGLIISGLVFSTKSEATYSENIPKYDYTDSTLLMSNRLLYGGYLGRVNGTMRANPSGGSLWLGPRRYPTVFDGDPDYGGAKSTLNTTFQAETKNGVENVSAYMFAFVHIAGPIDRGTKEGDKISKSQSSTAFNIQDVDEVKNNSTVIQNLFGGDRNYVLANAEKYDIQNYVTTVSYGKFYWIRDLAYWSGGEADNRQISGNNTDLMVIKTAPPDIASFVGKNGTTGKVGEKFYMDFNGYEYVSENRNNLTWKIDLISPSPYSGTIGGNLNSSKGMVNSSKNYLKKYSGKFAAGTTYFTPTKAGTYKLRLTITDAVQRTATKDITITITDDSGNIPPDSGGGNIGSCTAPSIIGGELRYKYEMDLAVTRIEGKTVEAGSQTITPVEVYRGDFSANREKVKQEIQADIDKTENEINKLKDEKAQLESEKAKLESDLATAQKGTQVQVCEDVKGSDGTTSQSCHEETKYDDALISSLQSQVQAKQSEIDQKSCEISTKEAEKAGYEKEMQDLQNLEAQFAIVNPDVQLTFNGTNKGSQTVSLREGETKLINFTWNLPSDGNVKAEINSYGTYDETTYSNNSLTTPIFVASHEIGACSSNNQVSSVKGVVRTITSNGGGTNYLYEYLTGQIVNQSRNTMRAGFGFSFNIQTNYINEDNSSSGVGPSSVYSYFPTLTNYLPYTMSKDGFQVLMNLTANTGSSKNETKTWSLPQTYVEKFSGNVFDSNYADNPNHNPDETMMNGGRKWYVDFEQPDGTYNFSSKTSNVGVNKLGVCMNGSVEVKGSIIGDQNGDDDFVKRSVTPNNPFPAGIGWNWLNNDSQITSLKDWYDNWSPNPSDIPSNTYIETFYLTPEKLQEIRDYNKSVDEKYNLGKSMFDVLNIPHLKTGG